MRISLILTFIVFQTLLAAQSNEIYHRARISLDGQSAILLSRLGIEVNHGKLVPKRYLENDFSDAEIDRIKKAGFDVEIVIQDVVSYYKNPDRPSELDQMINRQSNCNSKANPECQISEYETPLNYSGGSMGGYKTYEELIPHLDSMHLLYPHLISERINIDPFTTHDGNKVFYLKLSDNYEQDEDEPQVLYTALHHAREPNSLSQMLFFLWYCLENYDSDPEIKALVDNNELYFVPVINPDGYMINEANNPEGGGLWRKNAWRDETDQLFGVDLNRNYGFFWGYDNNGSSPNPGSSTFRGDSAFSEPETQALKWLCEQHKFQIALNYHTSGDLLIHPWGYNDEPTAEDNVFKGLGYQMINENCFTMGTGTETVGYVVNGDSDDWMYGDETTKNKIYSFTPEVGPSFWPPRQDIIDLNKSCMEMNIKAAQLTSNLFEFEAITNGPLTRIDSGIELVFTKVGLDPDPASITIDAVSQNISATPLEFDLDINAGQRYMVQFPFDFNPNIEDNEEVEVVVTVRGNGYTKEETYSFTYFNESPTEVYANDVETIDAFTTEGDWNVTDEYAYEGGFSLGDSPYINYRRNATTTATLNETFDLSNMAYAELTFAARWEIENDYDYAMVQASTDGISWVPLCGLYTNPGSSDQILGEPLYDNFQSDWVNEIISLEDFIGENAVSIRFVMHSDGFIEEEGIYIDNLKVNIISTAPSSNENISLTGSSIRPNPTNGLLYLDGISIGAVYNVINPSGKVVLSGINDGQVDISELPNGLYFITVTERESQQTFRVIKL
jgi:hypothetical protein